MTNFASQRTFDERYSTAKKLIDTYPNAVPVICEPARTSLIDVSSYHNTKYIVPRDSSLGKFLVKIRGYLDIGPEVAIFLFINNTLPPVAALMGDLYDKYKAKDGFLYLEFSGENVFGM